MAFGCNGMTWAARAGLRSVRFARDLRRVEGDSADTNPAAPSVRREHSVGYAVLPKLEIVTVTASAAAVGVEGVSNAGDVVV